MKNIILTLGLTTAMAGFHHIQAQYLSLGAKGGASINAFSEFPASDPLIGYNAGFFTWYSTQGTLAFGGDIIYTRTGGEYDRISPVFFPRSYKTALNYFAISPKIGLFLREYNKRFRPKFTFGPSVGLLVDAEEVNRSRDVESEFEVLNFGLVAGTGFNYEIARAVWLNADIDYNFGLNNVSTIGIVRPDRLTNQGLSLNLGLSFGVGRPATE